MLKAETGGDVNKGSYIPDYTNIKDTELTQFINKEEAKKTKKLMQSFDIRYAKVLFNIGRGRSKKRPLRKAWITR